MCKVVAKFFIKCALLTASSSFFHVSSTTCFRTGISFSMSALSRVYFSIKRGMLSKADAVEGVDEVPAGGLRVGCQASVVVVVQELARAAHEKAVLAEVQSLLDGGVGLDHDFEAVEGAEGNRLAVRARLVLPRPRDDVAVGGLVRQQGFHADVPLVHRLNHRLALLGLGFLNEAYLVFGDAVVFHQLALDFAVRVPLVRLVRAEVAEHELRPFMFGIAVVILRNHVGAMGRLVGAE